jgi:hypothetical protein
MCVALRLFTEGAIEKLIGLALLPGSVGALRSVVAPLARRREWGGARLSK